jgi:site-specific recombinase XerC
LSGDAIYAGVSCATASVLGLAVRDVDIGGQWVRVTGKGSKERRVPLDAEVGGMIQVYLARIPGK